MKTLHYTIILIIGICLLQSGCKNANDCNNDLNSNAKEVPKKLDPKKILIFQSLKNQEYIANDTLFKLEESDKVYTEITKPIHNNFERHTYYDKNSLKLKGDCYYFSKMIIGNYKFYDEKGNLIKEIDYDKGFSFTADDLILKVKQEFKIDLNKDLKGIEIYRGSHTFNFHTYTISMTLKTVNGYPKYRSIVIDGTFGFILFDRTYCHRRLIKLLRRVKAFL